MQYSLCISNTVILLVTMVCGRCTVACTMAKISPNFGSRRDWLSHNRDWFNIIQCYTCLRVCVVLLVCLSLPPWVRYLPGLTVLLGVIPGPACGNYQTYMQFVAETFAATSQGIYAFDAYERKEVSYHTNMILIHTSR